MSTASRLISGSMASWAQIAVNMAAQLVLVPIYLSYWNVETYGVWLAILGIMSILSMLDYGYQTYVGYEFLRIGAKNLPSLTKSMWSSVIFGALIGIFQLVLIGVFIFTNAIPFLLGEDKGGDPALIHGAGIALLLQGITWLFVNTIPGLMVRALAVFGYFHRTAWWSFAYAILAAVGPLIAVVMGADLLGASIVLAVCANGYGIALYFQLFRWLKLEGVKLMKPSLIIGFNNLKLSLPLLGKSILENVRQQGVRLLLAPIAGATGLAAFSTMRTGANVALQGLNTIVNPLVPDLMRFLHDRDQARSEAAFATVWIVVVAFLAPGIVILQALIEPLYLFWTQGKIAFNPLLFATLSLGVLIYAVIQPAMAVVIGNNLTKVQLWLAALGAVLVFVILGVLVPIIGILGAGISLLVAEIATAIGYKIYAQKWLNENNLLWPRKAFLLALISVLMSTVSLAGLVWFPQWKWLILGVSLIFFLWNLIRYLKCLPSVALENAYRISSKIPGIGVIAGKLVRLLQ
ncbi:MAG: polysaccharide biosynthesis C-terminal domain-containing protein [Chryseolinea sp.]